MLRQPARPFALPEEAEDARRVVAELHSALERVAQAHVFGKGMGIAAPQIGIGRAAAVVRTPGGEIITLLNPQIIDKSDDQDEQSPGSSPTRSTTSPPSSTPTTWPTPPT